MILVSGIAPGQESAGLDMRAAVVMDRQRRSYDWLRVNFYDEWEQVAKSYKCERDPEKDPNDPNRDDTSQTSIGMPDTWVAVRRGVARITAQLPDVRFHHKDRDAAELISRTIMYQWDKGGIQRVQKKHAQQGFQFGWSPRAWYFMKDTRKRVRRINPLDSALAPADFQAIVDTYAPKYNSSDEEFVATWQQNPSLVATKLMGKFSQAGLLPVEYEYTAFEGPKCDFVFVGDCFPEPNSQSIQSSNWFIVERRRNLQWLQRFTERYPEFNDGVANLIERWPNGSYWLEQQNEYTGLRHRMLAAIGRSDATQYSNSDPHTKEWTITEMHEPGTNPKLTMVGERSLFLGQIDYPYQLDGKIAFTELILIDDILSGIGDSYARIMRGLQQLHDRQVNARFDLVYNITHPLVGTTSRELYDNPQLLKRGKGMRLVWMRGPGELWQHGEQAAMAAAQANLADETPILRYIQMVTGDNNMSMAANVDPQQGRTATGARLLAYNQDLLTKDLVDMYTQTGLNADLEMMFLLNRSELSDAVWLRPADYRRNRAADEDPLKDEWVQADPVLFQLDGEIVAEAGSTLADDDEGKLEVAERLYQQAASNPHIWNVETARDNVLIAAGKGKELAKWRAQPQPPPPPPEIRVGLQVSAKYEDLNSQEQQAFLQRAQVPVGPPGGNALPPGASPTPGAESAMSSPRMSAPGPLPSPGGVQPQPPMPSALDAARGRSNGSPPRPQ